MQVQKPPRFACIFGGNLIDIAQDFESPQGDVIPVADGRGDNIKSARTDDHHVLF